MPEKSGKTHETSERYTPIRTDPGTQVIQIHTDEEMTQGMNFEINNRRLHRQKKLNRYGSVPFTV